jgi:hypothetical protein
MSRKSRAEFLSAREIGVSRTRTRYNARIFRRRFYLFARHYFLPMNEIAVFNRKRDGRAERFAVPHAGENFNRIAFDFHPSAASVTLLTTPELMVNFFDINF